MWRTKFHDQTRTLCFLSEHRMALWAVGLPGATLQKLKNWCIGTAKNYCSGCLCCPCNNMFKMSFVPVFWFQSESIRIFQFKQESNWPSNHLSNLSHHSCFMSQREKKAFSPQTFREEHQSHRRSAQLKHLGMDYHLWLWPKRFVTGRKTSKLPMLPEIQQQNPEVPWFSSQNITKILANIQQLGMLSCFHLSSSFHLNRKWGPLLHPPFTKLECASC